MVVPREVVGENVQVMGENVQVSPEFRPSDSKLQVPVKILQHRLVSRSVWSVLQVLVKWSSSPISKR
jgi:hypothetical protein